MSHANVEDPYQLHPEAVEDPPNTFVSILRRIGPGLILASAIVGSGELIATTVLGAENGYTLLWLILVSCAIKVVVQNELGRYVIGTGETALEAFNRVPGPRLRVSWVVWLWFVMVVMVMFAIGGMMGAISEVLNTIFPSISINAWVWVVGVVTAILLIVGRYNLVEKVAMGLIVVFTILTVGCAVLLFKHPGYFSWAELMNGLSFSPPEGGFVTAVAVFGITGVGATELVIYPYWCLEKGYARFAGRRDNSAAWQSRAQGWIQVMGVDVLNSMVIYTVSTVAFYLLGAGVLHSLGVVPQGAEMVNMLSTMYTATLGPWSRELFLVGAVAVLYSTVFASTAAHSRLLADFLAIMRVYDSRSYSTRLGATRVFVVILLLAPSLTFMFLQEPVLMVKIGGVSEALMLPIIGFSTIYLRHAHLPKAILPKRWITLALWLTSAVMLVMMGYSTIQQLTL
jgi:Mn2+/Fe2+ NRAMP family transporter